MFDLVNTPEKETRSWIYDTCNGYRNLNPSQIEFSLNDKNQVAITFNHIITLWDGEKNMEFVNDLIHCDPNDHIKYINLKETKNNEIISYFLNFSQILYTSSNIVSIHSGCINLWDLCLNYACIWSRQLNIENISLHPFDTSTVITIFNSKNENGSKKFDG